MPGLDRRPLSPVGEAGYTLTEMLVVVGIIGLIAAVVTPALVGQLGRARAKAAQLQLDTAAAQVEAYFSDTGRYPSAKEGLDALIAEPTDVDGWTGPYLRDRKALNDPWGRRLAYAIDSSGNGFVITSLGADGKAGGSGVNRDLRAPR